MSWSAFDMLEDGPDVTRALPALCREVPVAGRQVHDTNIVATMLAHAEGRLLTFDQEASRRSGDRIELVDPAANESRNAAASFLARSSLRDRGRLPRIS